MMLPTPKYDLQKYPNVYEPSEDTFLMLDALELEIDFIKKLNPSTVVEIGSGSGIIITAMASLLRNEVICFATDVNIQASQATLYNSTLNNVKVECLSMNLLKSFRNNSFDIILFNPPYVVTESDEINAGDLNKAWAGGKNGREVIDVVLNNLNNWLSVEGVCYVIALRENGLDDIKKTALNCGFKCNIVVSRRIPGEYLYVLKLFRVKS